MSKNTSKRTQNKTKSDALATVKALLKDIGAQVTDADKATARQLDALYKNKHSPQIVLSAIFTLFWELAKHYDVKLAKDFDKRWLAIWPSLLAAQRVQGSGVTSMRFTWQPTAEEEAELGAEEKAEAEARAVFDIINSKILPERMNSSLGDAALEVLDLASPFHTWEVFKIAWPLGLQRLAEKAEGSDEDE